VVVSEGVTLGRLGSKLCSQCKLLILVNTTVNWAMESASCCRLDCNQSRVW